MKTSYGTVFRVPKQEPGAIATCKHCHFSRFFPASRRKRGSSVSRAKRALWAHAWRKHPDKVFPAGMVVPVSTRRVLGAA